MTKEDTFVLLSLKDTEAKQLGKVIGSDTAKKILEALAKKEYTETELAHHLSIPLTTVHYNLQQLIKAKLVAHDEFHYSSRGREVTHYKLANKYVIIAPAGAQEGALDAIKEQLKRIIPIAAIIGVFGIFGNLWTKTTETVSPDLVAPFAQDAAPLMKSAAIETGIAADVAADAQAMMVQESVDTVAQAVPAADFATAIPTETIPVAEPNVWLWFIGGAVVAIVLYLIIDYIIRKIKS